MLTIGIPTYERREIVLGNVAALIEGGAAEQAEVLVIDDASSDGTRAALAELCAGTPVRVLGNEPNIGYAGNLLRLFAECRTPYLLVASDDDVVVVESLAPLKEMIEQRSPAFVSTRFRFGERLYRGRHSPSADDRVEPDQLFAASGHAPGLVYRVADCREVALPSLEQKLGEGSAAASVYPQVLILARLLLSGRDCLWWDHQVVEGGAEAPTGLGEDGSPYYHLAPRWRQLGDLLDFLDEERRSGADPAAAAAMTAKVQERAFWMLRSAISHERPDLLDPFDRRAARFYAIRWRWDRLRRRIAGRSRIRH
jgi:glycosyltransferase involved in cell wall biosynthesis